LFTVASFVPRPVIPDETLEDQQNVIEEMVDEKVECNDNDDPENFGEELATAESGSYTIHPSGRLTFVFKNSPQHCSSPAHSPVMSTAAAVRDVRVKLERCNDSETPTKRSRLEDESEMSLPQANPFQQLRFEAKDEDALSEADTAVAGLLGSSTGGTDIVFDTTDVTAADFRQLHDGMDIYSVSDSASMRHDAFSDLEQNVDRLHENGVVLTDSEEDNTVLSDDGGVVTQTGSSDGEIMAAVGSLMADLSQLNALTSQTVRPVIPNGSVYLPASKFSLAKLALDVTNTQSVDNSASSCEVASASVQQHSPHLDISTTHSSLSFPFCNSAKYATSSDHESDLDAAIKSILS